MTLSADRSGLRSSATASATVRNVKVHAQASPQALHPEGKTVSTEIYIYISSNISQLYCMTPPTILL